MYIIFCDFSAASPAGLAPCACRRCSAGAVRAADGTFPHVAAQQQPVLLRLLALLVKHLHAPLSRRWRPSLVGTHGKRQRCSSPGFSLPGRRTMTPPPPTRPAAISCCSCCLPGRGGDGARWRRNTSVDAGWKTTGCCVGNRPLRSSAVVVGANSQRWRGAAPAAAPSGAPQYDAPNAGRHGFRLRSPVRQAGAPPLHNPDSESFASGTAHISCLDVAGKDSGASVGSKARASRGASRQPTAAPLGEATHAAVAQRAALGVRCTGDSSRLRRRPRPPRPPPRKAAAAPRLPRPRRGGKKQPAATAAVSPCALRRQELAAAAPEEVRPSSRSRRQQQPALSAIAGLGRVSPTPGSGSGFACPRISAERVSACAAHAAAPAAREAVMVGGARPLRQAWREPTPCPEPQAHRLPWPPASSAGRGMAFMAYSPSCCCAMWALSRCARSIPRGGVRMGPADDV